MEVIGGKDVLDTEVVKYKQKEGNCRFNFNFRDVYWNSKLSHERDRIIPSLKPSEVICDMFAGVGPFSIRAAKYGCRVIANDLNPSCYECLLKNAIKNKVTNKISAYNLDAREFILRLLSTKSEETKCDDSLRSPPMENLPKIFHHVYMNLPMDAIEFLDVFKHQFDPDT